MIYIICSSLLLAFTDKLDTDTYLLVCTLGIIELTIELFILVDYLGI